MVTNMQRFAKALGLALVFGLPLHQLLSPRIPTVDGSHVSGLWCSRGYGYAGMALVAAHPNCGYAAGVMVMHETISSCRSASQLWMGGAGGGGWEVRVEVDGTGRGG